MFRAPLSVITVGAVFCNLTVHLLYLSVYSVVSQDVDQAFDFSLILCVHLRRFWSMAVAYVGRACLFSMAFFKYWIPSQRSQISSNCLGRISAPLFRVKPVSSRLSSHISMSSLPEQPKGKDKDLLAVHSLGHLTSHSFSQSHRFIRLPHAHAWRACAAGSKLKMIQCFYKVLKVHKAKEWAVLAHC